VEQQTFLLTASITDQPDSLMRKNISGDYAENMQNSRAFVKKT
jgi:hypothetical protein